MLTFIKSFIVTVLIIMFGIAIAELLTGCTWHARSKIQCETSTKIERTCTGEGTGKKLEIITEKRTDE